MEIDKQGAQGWRVQLRKVLNTVWDPIGGCPPDEYDRYGGRVAAMVREGDSDKAIREYLSWVEAGHMGFGLANQERLARVIAAIRELGPIP